MTSSIVEYATREQAQQAVNTLSNQNLMGRLVYVREVRIPTESLCEDDPSIVLHPADMHVCGRTANPNHASQDHQPHVEVTREALGVVATVAGASEGPPPATDGKSSSTMFVSSCGMLHIPRPLLTDDIAALHCWLARS